MKKILFIITSKKKANTGFGGHYYSLLTYVRKLRERFNLEILHYSELDNTLLDLEKLEGIKYWKLPFSNKYYNNIATPDIVVFFGPPVNLHYLRVKFLLRGTPTIIIKPGGKNFNNFFVFFDYIICFSQENYLWFKKNYIFRKFSKIELLPNRIDTIPVNEQRLQRFKYVKKGYINILRISRINKTFLDAFEKSINLHKKLAEAGFQVNSVFIGVIADHNTYLELKKKVDEISNIHILTNDLYTNNAREFIPLFDIITGIGRGFMEAASEKKVVLGFSKHYNIPVVVDDVNYKHFKEFNFSLRNTYCGNDVNTEFQKIISILKDKKSAKKNEEFLYNKFIDDYDSNKLLEFFSNTGFNSKYSKFLFVFDFTFLFFKLIKKNLNIRKHT